MSQTSATRDLHVVLGGTGAAGNALVRELARLGLRARAVSRKDRGGWPAGVEWAAGDASRPESVAAVSEGAAVVYHAAQPEYTRWPEEFPPMTEAVLEGVSRTGARLVFVDNLYAYGPQNGPLSEATPQAATDRKGKTRALMANRLLEAHRSGRARVAIGRASDYYGPGVEGSSAGEAYFKAILAGRRPLWFGRADQPHALTFVDDYARALVALATREDAYGELWHVPTAEPLTNRDFARLVAEVAGVPYRAPLVMPALAVRALGLAVPMMRELSEIAYQAERPFVVDGSRFAAAFGFEPTPHREAIRRTVEWMRAHAQQGQAARL